MNILLFANIGSSPEGYYHVGDEAMFLETYRWYRSAHPDYKLTVFTSTPNHGNLQLTEIQLPPIPSVSFRKYWLGYLIKSIVFRLSGFSLLGNQEKKLLGTIINQHTIHFCGGGNLTSHFRPWLYFSLTLILTAKIFGKKIYLTSQTIGPFSFQDKIISKAIISLVDVIKVREPILNTYLRSFKSISSSLDAATTLPLVPVQLPNSSKIKIGLSLHSWGHYDSSLSTAFIDFVNNISQKYKVEFFLLPHIIIKKDFYRGGDYLFLNSIFCQIPKKHQHNPKSLEIIDKSDYETANAVKTLTSQCDLLISTRYHGNVFALSSGVPCISFLAGSYYSQKNTGLFKFYYPKTYNQYLVDLDKPQVSQSLTSKTDKIINSLTKHKLYLRNTNIKLFSKSKLQFYHGIKY